MGSVRVLHFSHCFLPVYGGRTVRLQNLLSHTKDIHYLYVPKNAGYYQYDETIPLVDEDIYGNIRVHRRYFPDPRYGLRIPVVNSFRYVREVSRGLLELVDESEEIDLVHGHDPLILSWSAMQLARRKGLPFLHEAHTTMALEASVDEEQRRIPGWVRKVMRLPWLLREREVFGSARLIVVPTEAMGRHTCERFGLDEEKIEVIPNGVDTRLFDPEDWKEKGRDLRERKGWRDKVVFMYAGLLDHINGVDFFLDAAEELPAEVKGKAKIVIVGRGYLQGYVRDKARENHGFVEYLGLLSHEEMPTYYAGCDVFVVPRPSTLVAEHLVPLKLLEALAMSKPVLVSSVGGLTEVVEDGKNGLVFEKGKKEDLVRKLKNIVNQAGQVHQLGTNGRVAVIGKYNWERSRAKLERVYERLCGSLTPRAMDIPAGSHSA